jgi:hypothetical protein
MPPSARDCGDYTKQKHSKILSMVCLAVDLSEASAHFSRSFFLSCRQYSCHLLWKRKKRGCKNAMTTIECSAKELNSPKEGSL